MDTCKYPTLPAGAVADADNRGSIGVMEKLGMQNVDDHVHKMPKQDYPVVYVEMSANRE